MGWRTELYKEFLQKVDDGKLELDDWNEIIILINNIDLKLGIIKNERNKY